MDVTDVLRDRMHEPSGFQRMVSVSLFLHGLAIAIVLLAPKNWIAREEAPRSVMTISLGGGGAGPAAGGLTAIGGRPVQVQTKPEDAAKREALRAPAAKAPEMTLPVKGAPAKAGSTAVKQSSADARGRTPAKGSEVRAGSAVAETGTRGQGFGLSSGGGPGLGTTLDVADFCCPEYLTTMIDRIRSNWDPAAGVGATWPTMKFTIQRDGRITDAILENRSGRDDLDLAVRRAVLVTKQLPPLPQAFPNPTLTLHLTFQYPK